MELLLYSSCANHFGSDGSRGYEVGDILCTLISNGPTFRGSNCAIFIFVSPSQWGGGVVPLRADPFWKCFDTGKQTESQKVFSW